jgi:hypothetical protein
MTEFTSANANQPAATQDRAELPEGVVRLTPSLTATAPTKGLHDPFTGTDQRLALVVVRRPIGSADYSIYSDVFVCSTPDDLERSLTMRFYFPPGRPGLAHVMLLPQSVAYDPWGYDGRELMGFFRSPWGRMPWARAHVLRWVEHLPAPSETVPGLLSYYQSPEKRARNIRTPIKPGKYLKKFFADVLSEEQIHELALMWSNAYSLRKLNVTQDADEIEQVYRGAYNGSCMHFGNGEFSGPEHPARVYAGPDLGIAYIGDAEKADARCLVWPEKKIFYPKWYGDGPRLEAALLADGWKAADEDAFQGARLRRIPVDEYEERFVAPYVDVSERLRDDGEYLIIDHHGGIDTRFTNGLSAPVLRCDDCGAGTDVDDSYATYDGRVICSCCIRDDYFRCDSADAYYPNEQRAPTPEGEDYSYSTDAMERMVASDRWFYCDVTETNYPARLHEAVRLTDYRTCELSYAEANGYFCAAADAWSLNVDGRLTLSDDREVDRDGFPSLTALREWLESEGVTATGADHAPDQLTLELAA